MSPLAPATQALSTTQQASRGRKSLWQLTRARARDTRSQLPSRGTHVRGGHQQRQVFVLRPPGGALRLHAHAQQPGGLPHASTSPGARLARLEAALHGGGGGGDDFRAGELTIPSHRLQLSVCVAQPAMGCAELLLELTNLRRRRRIQALLRHGNQCRIGCRRVNPLVVLETRCARHGLQCIQASLIPYDAGLTMNSLKRFTTPCHRRWWRRRANTGGWWRLVPTQTRRAR